MKRILITGANSYIGTSFEKWLQQWPDKYYVNTIDMIDGSWRQKSFTGYDVVFHVAGIAHVKETKKNKELYYRVNRDLTYETATKARAEGVKHFIFLSSMSVYGIENGVINRNTLLNPTTNYGKSKLQAEKLIQPLNDDSFKVVILRPPMVYGKGCKGNYPRLARLAVVAPFFPDIDNRRSMIYIDNLCEFVRMLIDDFRDGIFVPQNSEYVKTSEMVMLIAQMHGRQIKLTKRLNSMVKNLGFRYGVINKIFGNLICDKELSDHKAKYCIYNFEESIKLTELRGIK